MTILHNKYIAQYNNCIIFVGRFARHARGRTLGKSARFRGVVVNLTSYWNERKAHETGVVPISSGYTLGFWRGREERCQAQFL